MRPRFHTQALFYGDIPRKNLSLNCSCSRESENRAENRDELSKGTSQSNWSISLLFDACYRHRKHDPFLETQGDLRHNIDSVFHSDRRPDLANGSCNSKSLRDFLPGG